MKRLPLLRALWVVAVFAHAAQGQDALQREVAASGMANPQRLERQRPVDARLLKIEERGLEECGLFKGEVHVARDAAAVRALSGKLRPGDQLVLGAGEWKDARFSFHAQGTEAAPILIRPESPGTTWFSGTTEIGFYGADLVVWGLEFHKVRPAKNAAVALRIGSSTEEAFRCLIGRVRFQHCGSVSPEDWPRVGMWLMNVAGADHTVAHCEFDGLKNRGQMLGAGNLPKERLQRLHVLHNRFRARPKVNDENGYEVIQIGWSGEKAGPAGSLLEGNTFEECDGENEIVALKASDVVVRQNRFVRCQGVLSLRSANRVLVEENLFDGEGRANTGGITLSGSDHVIIGNTFRALAKPQNYYFWALGMAAASAENYGEGGDVEGYGRVRNVLVAGNRFERCDTRIALGTYPRKDYPLLPRQVVVRGNVFTGTTATSPFDFLAPDASGELERSLRMEGNRFER